MRSPIAWVVSYALLLSAWAMTNPPGAAPDEYGHYLRAIAAGKGILAPDERPPPLPPAEASQISSQWQRRQSRIIQVPGRLSPETFNRCLPRATMAAWDCPKKETEPQEDAWLLSIVGTYPPYGYLAPGLLSRLGSQTTQALLWARGACALSVVIMLGLAAWALWDPRRAWVCLLGSLAAVTPMVIFVGSSLTPSGLEIASGICFLACLLRLGRDGEKPRGGVWIAAGTSGAILAMLRDPGIFWVVGGLAIAISLSGPRMFREKLREAGRPEYLSLFFLLTGLAAAIAWQILVQVHPGFELSGVFRDFPERLSITKEVGRQQIGVFGWLDTLLPAGAYVAWVALLAVLGALALLCGSWLQRAVLAASVGAAVAVPVVVDIVQRSVGFGVQGRHVLPFTVVVPLVAGEILSRNAEKLGWLKKARPMIWFSLVATSINCLAWFVNARRYTVGPRGPLRFWAELNGAPPLSWTAWGLVVTLAGLLGVYFGVRASGPNPPHPTLLRKFARSYAATRLG